ncbi:hypothetical protein TELCIR_07692 [Teladorsagia circumcincta]|uniref:Uncharacterized protein n=1 Tax=Teladorsagia circumcincta TaxID=45464 RepID=A0A2G9UJM0_TELCI|nr:hypothetical protein TELCIR_07692 [Teladorsagia circumcincta]
MLGASSLDPSSSASPWHTASAPVVAHPSSNSRPSKPSLSPKTETNLPVSFAHAAVKEEYSHIEPVASTSSEKSGASEESASCEADDSRRQSVSKVKVGDGETVSVNDVPPPQPVKVEEKRPEQPVERSSQQQPGMVGGPPANVPPHHQSYSPAGTYMYPGNGPPHQHPHSANVQQSAGPPIMDPQQHMAMQQQMQMEHRQRMMMQQQQAHAAAVAAAQAQQQQQQQHPVPGQPQQAPLTPGGFYNPATPVQQAQVQQQRPPMGYAGQPQNPGMFVGQPQQPQQVPVNVQQQRMQSYPAHMKPGSMPTPNPVVPGQFRGPPVEMMGHAGYPPGPNYPTSQAGMPGVPAQYPVYPQGSNAATDVVSTTTCPTTSRTHGWIKPSSWWAAMAYSARASSAISHPYR